jgi:hypothetical protein
MAGRMIVHDFRLTGAVPSGLGANVYQVTVRTSLSHAFNWVAQHSDRVGGLDDLWIWCHGFEAVIDDDDLSSCYQAGGFGLELCQENLTFDTVSVTNVLKSPRRRVRRIVVFSCAAADSPGTASARRAGSDGMRLMGELALWSGASVIASDQTQIYHWRPTMMQRLLGDTTRNDFPIDFGEWEGNVYEFSPDTGRPTPVVTPLRPVYAV